MHHGHANPWSYPWRTYRLAVDLANATTPARPQQQLTG
jgi:hypothetical protein